MINPHNWGLLKRLFINFQQSIKSIQSTAANFSPIASAELNKTQETLKVGFSNGDIHEYPWLFLQDNCPCPKCFHSSSQSRSRKMTQLNLENGIVKVKSNSESVSCEWKDGHESIFKEKWLKERRFTIDNLSYRKTGSRDHPELVGSDYTIQRENFEDVMKKDANLLTMLKVLSKTGVFIIEDAPKEVGQLKKIANRFGFIRLTHYGYEFTVKSEKNAVNLAYTSTKLNLHTDLPYYASPPGTQLLHCIQQYKIEDKGGQSQLVDGFLVAEQMRKNHPEEFKILHQVPVEFYDIGKDFTEFHKIHHSPTFVLNSETNRVTRIVYSNQQLSSFQPIPLKKVKPLYSALKLFTDLCYKPGNLMEFKLKEGEVLFFDNWRFLHGREAFDPSLGDRHLEGCYVDWDEIFSRIRVLES